MTLTAPHPGSARKTGTRSGLIDCDIHPVPPSLDALKPYLAERWRTHLETIGSRRFTGHTYPKANAAACRVDAWPPTGGPPGSDLDWMREQLLDRWEIRMGILNPINHYGGQVQPRFSTALAAATNSWMVEHLLEPEPRLRASIALNQEDPAEAVAEIERRAGDPAFVQVLMLVRSQELLGGLKYRPILETAAAHGLPVAVHFGGTSVHPLTGAGMPSYYVEDHGGMAQAFQAHVASLVLNGVFESLPDLQLILMEGGMAWVPSLCWRMDHLWKTMRAEVPELTRAPSSYVRSNLWITTQPMEEPPDRHQFDQMLNHLDMDDRILFATDYPHWDFDAPDRAFPVRLSAGREAAYFYRNACRLYGLPEQP
ncbi:MAG: amidohydrolase family protein [Opitutales bacterium]